MKIKHSTTLDELYAVFERNNKREVAIHAVKLDRASDVLDANDKARLISAIKKNTNITHLALDEIETSNELISFMVSALQENYTITQFSYNLEGILQEYINEIDRIIRRNRECALNQRVEYQQVRLDEKEISSKENIIHTAFSAVSSRDVNKLGTCLERFPFLINVTGYNGDTLLHTAVEHGFVDCVQLLIARGADVNFVTRLSATALHQAIHARDYVIAKLLLSAGANTEKTFEDTTPILWVNEIEMALLLIRHGANIHVVVGENSPHSEYIGANILFMKDVICQPDLLYFFLKKGINVNSRNQAGRTPLHQLLINTSRLTEKKFLRIVNILIVAGANPTLKDNQGMTALDLGLVHSKRFAPIFKQITEAYIRVRKVSLLFHQAIRNQAPGFPSGLPVAEIAKWEARSSMLSDDATNKITTLNNHKPR